MENLKAKWEAQETPVKIAIGAGVAILSVVILFKVLPAVLGALSFGAIVAIFVLPYWIPTVVAFVRHHPSKGGILVLNMFFGWTFVGWVISLVWALSDNTGRAVTNTVVVNTAVTTAAPPQSYRVGDVVNGHHFDGSGWVPLPQPPAAPELGGTAAPTAGSAVLEDPSAIRADERS